MENSSEATDFIKKIKVGMSADEWLYWAITVKGQSKLIGTICIWQFSDPFFKAELGYELLPEFRGNGFMNEALKDVIQFGMGTVGLATLEAATHKNNLASIRLLAKNGFTSAGGLKERDMVLFQLKS